MDVSQLRLREHSVSVISFFEFWEDGIQLARSLDAHPFNFPRSITVMNPWNFESKTLSLSEAVGVRNFWQGGGTRRGGNEADERGRRTR